MVERKVAANGVGVVDASTSQPADEPDDQDDEGNSADRQDQVQRAHDSGTSWPANAEIGRISRTIRPGAAGGNRTNMYRPPSIPGINP
jgi:hypothetical protein